MREPYAGAVSASVLGHVGQRLAGYEVGRTLHIIGEPLGTQPIVGKDLHRDGVPRNPGLQRCDEPVVAEHRRVDAVGEFPEVPKHLAGLILQIGEFGGGELVTTESVAGEPKTRDEGHDLLLDPVM